MGAVEIGKEETMTKSAEFWICFIGMIAGIGIVIYFLGHSKPGD